MVDKVTYLIIMKRVVDWFCKKIPKVSNRVIINFYEILRFLNKLKPKKNKIKKALEENTLKFIDHINQINKCDGYIEDQNNYTDMKYGKVTMQYAGCEIIATFNAINNILGECKKNLGEMIQEFEKDGCVLSGKFGTAPKAIADYLNKNGFVSKISLKEVDFDKIAEESESLILTMYNDVNDIRKEIHTINISKNAGKYIGHNVYCNGIIVGPFDTVSELINNINSGKAKGISLIGIRRK